MQDIIDLKNPHRAIRVGVILLNSSVQSIPFPLMNNTDSHNRRTEILDVAPLDVFTGLSKEIIQNFLPGFVTEDMAKQALDIEFHWVTEHGQDAVLTAGATIKATVSGRLFQTYHPDANVDSTISNHAPSWTLPLWEPTR